jgi:two-component system, cell cycle sensor histidine kinase and response regulator CckA
MSPPAPSFAEQYGCALDAYLSEPSEMLLAREMGERAVALGIGLAQLASVHAEQSGAADASRAWPFFVAALSAFEQAREELGRANAALGYRAMFDDNPIPMWIFDRETLCFVVVNDAAVRQYGYSREEFASMTLADIRPREDVGALRADVERAPRFAEGRLWRHRKKDGTLFTVEIRAHEFEFGRRPVRLVLATDVTERLRAEDALRKAEEQLRHAQKMEAVGRLAGGVAHDFNNLLSVILSCAELMLADLELEQPVRDGAEQMRRAAERAADLTRQLLMFSRQQVLEPRVVDLNEVLVKMDKMFQRIIGVDIDLVLVCAPSLGRVRVDPGSIEQVVMNLVVNARDAMPLGGRLTMETANVTIDEERAREQIGSKPGPHVMLAVRDTGIGMDDSTQAHIFEPFFTTKEKGKGTGLGLSTVFGIVQQSQGSILVDSEPGRGTSVEIYIPRIDDPVDEVPVVQRPAMLRGTETILLVEDDDQVRAVTLAILRRYGYRVLEARNGGEALLLWETHAHEIQLMISDVVMPHMSGPALARRLARERPSMKVLCMSGFTDDSIVRHGVMDSDIAYLQKPITPETLTRKVREVLDG